MRDLVDTRLPRLGWVALANREEQQCGAFRLHVDREDGSPATVGLRDVVLDAATEFGSVSGFGLAGP